MNRRIVLGIIVVFLLFICTCFIYIHNHPYKLQNSYGDVKVYNVNKDDLTKSRVSYDLEYIEVEAIFDKYDTNIIEGKVKEIRYINIKVGERQEVRAIVKFDVKKVFRGKIAEGQIVEILIPVYSTISKVSDCVEIGDTAIFMIVEYDKGGEEYYLKSGDSKLFLRDVANYGVPNGVNWIFLNKGESFIFAKDLYKDIADVKSWEKIREYISSKI